MKTLLINGSDCQEHLSMLECIETMRAAFQDLSDGQAINHPRDILFLPESALGSMSAYSTRLQSASTKVAGVFPNNSNTPKDVHQGAIILFDIKNGSLIAILDASYITAIRTAATSAFVTDHLAKIDAKNLVVFGAGVQAYYHILAMNAVRPLERVTIVNRSVNRAQALRERLNSDPRIEIVEPEMVPARIAEADIICTTTSSPEPIFNSKNISPHCHVNAVGACTPDHREIDTHLVHNSVVYVDKLEAAMKEAGELATAGISPKEISTLFQHLKRQHEKPTLFKSVGIGIQDLYAADFIYQKALQQKNNHSIPFGGLK